jgi:hypothetical protein
VAHPGFLILRLVRYPAWRLTVNGHPVNSLENREDGLIAFAVPQGPVAVAVDWVTTGDVVAGRCLSAFAVIALLGLWLLERRLLRARPA